MDQNTNSNESQDIDINEYRLNQLEKNQDKLNDKVDSSLHEITNVIADIRVDIAEHRETMTNALARKPKK